MRISMLIGGGGIWCDSGLPYEVWYNDWIHDYDYVYSVYMMYWYDLSFIEQ